MATKCHRPPRLCHEGTKPGHQRIHPNHTVVTDTKLARLLL